MPSSQLKRLKASLREQGIIGPQQSKKQKKKNAQDERAGNEKRLQRSEALENIREQFNPFQFKTNAKGPKFAVTTNRPATASVAKGIHGRPGVAKAMGEEKRRQTLLVEMQRRNKVGGILDRRFGEGDPTMTPEAMMAERFAREKQRSHKKHSIFDLEDDGPSGGLTHMGRSLSLLDEPQLKDDFDEEDLLSDEGSEASDNARKKLKRLREQIAMDEEERGDEDIPERKKSKKEVMEEVIAKSKLYKYERQVAKEDDEEIRMELDKELPNIQALLMGGKKGRRDDLNASGAPKPEVIAGVDRDAFEKDYDLRVKQLAADRRAKPTERTKTDEEIAEEESKRLKELEEKRLKRMRGESVSDSDEDVSEDEPSALSDVDMAEQGSSEEADDFGLGKGIKQRPSAAELGFDDEDDFIIDNDLVASQSDLDSDDEGSEVDSEAGVEEEDEDDEFTKGLLLEGELKDTIFNADAQKTGAASGDDGLPFTFPCPRSHSELLDITKDIPLSKLPTVIQRIRALYHPKLDSHNKERLADFSRALMKHIPFLGLLEDSGKYPIIENLIRHLHSLAKMFPIEIAKEFRSHLEELGRLRPLTPNLGDLFVLTAIGSIFPTSDHFHQVVTPAMLSMGRYLGQKVPRGLEDYATSTYLSILALQYQRLSKRFVPEVMNATLNTLSALAPRSSDGLVLFPLHAPSNGIRTTDAKKTPVRKLECSDCHPAGGAVMTSSANSTKVAILSANISILTAAAEIWTGKPAFHGTFEPALKTMKHLVSKPCRAHLPESLVQEAERSSAMLERMLKIAHLSRRPLELHHHKPLAIKTYIPKFEDSFDPNKHYDPDRERAELAKLKAEHKKERKGAMRELRKDANFMAREKLKLKKEKDAAYEKKYKRLVAEIQGEEGREANAYEREKQARKRARKSR